MKWVAITKKTGREMIRDRMALFFSLLFPLIFILIFGLAFGTFTGGNTTYEIAVINLDEGMEINNTTVNHGDNFVKVLKDMKYLDGNGKNTSQHMFNARTDLSEEKAQELVEDKDLTAYIIIPENFSKAMYAESMIYIQTAVSQSFQDIFEGGNTDFNLSNLPTIPEYNDTAEAMVILQGDPGQMNYFAASGILEGVLKGYIEKNNIITLELTKDYLPPGLEPEVQEPHVNIENLAMKSSEYSVFDYMVPGIIVFGILMSGIGVAISLTKEESKGTLTRLKLTKMTSSDMLFGFTIPFTILAVLQVLILLSVALLMGYNYNPNANLGLAIFIALWGCIATVALGLILASIAKNEEQAGSISPAIIVPVSFLTGSFFPLPTVTLTDNFLGTGKSFELFDWLPWTQCSKALVKVMTFGKGLGDVTLEISLMILFTLILFIIGVTLFHKKRLRSS